MNSTLKLQLSSLLAASLLSSASWSQDEQRLIWFDVAQKSQEATNGSSFSVQINNWKCRVNGKGQGKCLDKGNAWNFKLPVADGLVSNIYVDANGQGNLVYSVDNGETVWGVAAQVTPPRVNPKWVTQVPGLNFTTPLLHEDRVIVASSVSVAAISTATGEWIWRHQWVHDGGAAFAPTISVDSGGLRFTVVATNSKAVGEPVCFRLDFGSVVTCK